MATVYTLVVHDGKERADGKKQLLATYRGQAHLYASIVEGQNQQFLWVSPSGDIIKVEEIAIRPGWRLANENDNTSLPINVTYYSNKSS